MRKIILIFSFFFIDKTFSQTRDSILYYINNCKSSLEILTNFEKLIETYQYESSAEKSIDLFNLAGEYALINNFNKAYESLENCFKVDNIATSALSQNPNFYSLINQKRWFKFLLQHKPEAYKQMNDSLYYNLSKIAIQDQTLYDQVFCAQKKYGSRSLQATRLWGIKDSLNKNNLLTVKKYLADNINVLSNRVVGTVFASKCFLVIQHSDSVTMLKFLPIIKTLYENGETDGENYALLFDRVSLELL